MKKIITLFGVALFAGSANANLVINGGFEDAGATTVSIQNPPVVAQSIPGWRVFNTDTHAMIFEVVSNATVATEGSHYLKVTTVDSGGDGFDAGVDTDSRIALNDVTSGVLYTVSFDLQHVSGINSVLLKMQTTTNGVNADVFVANEVLAPATGAWIHYSYEITPTVDGDFYIGFRPKTGSTIRDQVFLLDNVNLEVIPEPATLGLIGFAAAGLIALRRL